MINCHFKSVSKLSVMSLFLCFTSFSSIVQAVETTVTSGTVRIKDDHYSLSNPLHNDKDSSGKLLSTMTYDSAKVNELGAAFSMEYRNVPGTSGFDGYAQGTVGGAKYGGAWHSGSFSLTGMPVQIKELDDSLRLQWKTFQKNAYDENDKWWATINVIFDSLGRHIEPEDTDRDFDIVIELERYEQDELSDKSPGNSSYWWFARNSDGTIKPFVLTIDGKEYRWGVRYKFFNYPQSHNSEHKNNKVHIKYIPMDNSNVAPYLDHPLKTFVDTAKAYLQDTDLPDAEMALSVAKMDDNLWVKSVRAGYEVYTGESTLGNEYFRTEIDVTSPNAPSGLSVNSADNLTINWSANSSDDPIEYYNVYRSVDGAAFKLLDVKVYTNQYVDLDVIEGKNYEYYVTATDRSFNTSQDSDVINATGSVTPTPAPVVEETESDTSSGGGSFAWLLAGGLFLLRRRVL